jgi:hypothetical protein
MMKASKSIQRQIMGTQQENQPRKPNQQQQQGGGKQSTSPRSPGEIGKGDQDAGTIGSPSGESDRDRGGNRDKGNS